MALYNNETLKELDCKYHQDAGVLKDDLAPTPPIPQSAGAAQV